MAAIADARGIAIDWQDTWQPSLSYVVTWLVILPPTLLLARRWPITTPVRWWRLAIAFIARPVLAVVATVLQLQLHFVLTDVGVLPATATPLWDEGGTMFYVGRFTEGVVLAMVALVIDALYVRARAEHARELRDARLVSQLAEARLAALTMELQPHFLFNTLNAISTLVHSDADAADRMIARLSTLLRRTLEAGRLPMASLTEEIQLLEMYLDIQRIRFGPRLSVAVDVPDELHDAQVPRLLLQPLVENAIQHGLTPKPGRVRLDVRARREGDALILSVRDDGVGVAPDMREGTGLTNTRSRLAQLYPERHRVSLGADASGGTHVFLKIPFEER
jgi:signal transduction histidine kinase